MPARSSRQAEFSSLTFSLHAINLQQFGKPYKLHRVPTPKISGPYDVLVKVAAASYCHTDVLVQAGVMKTTLPCTASHEGAGTVLAVGDAVDQLRPGDRVMCGLFRDLCGTCEDCRYDDGSYSQYCQYSKGASGVDIDGNFAEYMVTDSRDAVKLPDSLDLDAVPPFACAGRTIFSGIKRSGVQANQWLGIIGGGGGLGHLGIQFCRSLGINVISVDARDDALDLSRQMGAHVTLDARSGQDTLVSEVLRVTNGQGVMSSINVADARDAVATACAITRKHGTLIQISQPPELVIPFHEVIFRDIRVRGSLISSSEEAKEMLDLVAKHNIRAKTTIFQGLEEIPKLVSSLEGGNMTGKGVVIVDRSQI
jgi:alcohol dehydrogenase, propanol-preferring